MLWNESGVIFEASVGISSTVVPNCVVLSTDASLQAPQMWQPAFDVLVEVFDPEFAMVTDRRLLTAAPPGRPWDSGWLRFAQGASRRYPEFEPRDG